MINSQTFKTITQYSRQMMVKARTVLAGDSKCFPKITKLTRDEKTDKELTKSFRESPRAARRCPFHKRSQSYPDLPRAAQRYPELARTTQSCAKLRKKYPELPIATQEHSELPRAAQKCKKLLTATKTKQRLTELTRKHDTTSDW